jgi:hypothetical protein
MGGSASGNDRTVEDLLPGPVDDSFHSNCHFHAVTRRTQSPPPTPIEYGFQAGRVALISLIGAKKVESGKTDLSSDLVEGWTPRVQRRSH